MRFWGDDVGFRLGSQPLPSPGPTPLGPPPSAAPPPKSRQPPIALLAALIILYSVAAGALFGVSQVPPPPPPEPQVSLTNFHLTDQRNCGPLRIGGPILLTFNLTEHNDVDAVVLVGFFRDGVEVGREVHDVAGRTVRPVSKVMFTDCDDHYLEARILRVTRK